MKKKKIYRSAKAEVISIYFVWQMVDYNYKGVTLPHEKGN